MRIPGYKAPPPNLVPALLAVWDGAASPLIDHNLSAHLARVRKGEEVVRGEGEIHPRSPPPLDSELRRFCLFQCQSGSRLIEAASPSTLYTTLIMSCSLPPEGGSTEQLLQNNVTFMFFTFFIKHFSPSHLLRWTPHNY